MGAVEVLVELLQPRDRHPLRHEQEVHAIHLLPVLVEFTEVADRLVDRGPGKGSELRQVEVVDGKGEDVLHAPADALLRLAREPHHQQPLGPYPHVLDHPDLPGDVVQVDVPPMACQQLPVARLDPEAHHPAAGRFHPAHQLDVDVFGPDGAIEGHAERPVDHHPGERLDPRPVEGELVVVEVDVTGAEPFLQVTEVLVEIFGRVVTEAAAEHRAVAVAAGVGTAAAGDAAGVRHPRVVEDRELVGFGEPFQLLVGREGEVVQLDPVLPVPGEAGGAFRPLPVDDPPDSRRILAPALDQFRQRLLAFPDHGEVHRGECREERFLEGGDVVAPEDRPDARKRRAGRLGDPYPVEEAGGGAAEADEGGTLGEEVVPDPPVRPGAGVAIDDGGADAAPFETGRHARQPDGGHDVGDPGDVPGGVFGAVPEGVHEQDPVGIQHDASPGNRIRVSQSRPRYPKP